MKALIVIMILVFYMPLFSQVYFEKPSHRSVTVEISPLANRTIDGWAYGISVGLSINEKWDFGYLNINGLTNSELNKESFSGIYLQRAFNPKSRLVISSNLKVGYYSKRFLAIQPSIQANYKVKPNTSVLIGVGRVDNYPSFDLGLKLRLKRLK